jgi:UDP-N-acetylmuramoyl-L-alanyl-D-glutamate--2,6-diaminopimelate ligase
MLGAVDLAGILSTLGLPPRGDLPHVTITDLAYDSRAVSPGSLFFCIRGDRDDGHRHAGAAVGGGAVALVCERPLPLDIPQVVVDDARAAMNAIAAPFYGHPSRELSVVGVTGTNGKTTTTYMLESVFRAQGSPSGLIGTVETRVGDEVTPGVRTTPEAVDLQRLLRRMAGVGVTACAVEVTSIGIMQGRVEGTSFGVAAFTNLTQDHLDYHGTIEEYYQAKRRLFSPEVARVAVVNADDPWGERLASESAGSGLETMTYGIDRPATLVASDVRHHAAGSSFHARGMGIDRVIEIRLPGTFNVSNALAAAASAAALGVPEGVIAEGLASLRGVPGRFEPVEEGQAFAVVVDYAHTPDGIARVLDAARGITRGSGGRLLAVFGCGGDRDRAKRPLMGRAAAERADVVYLTSDNPRSEDPLAILDEILPGAEAAPPPGRVQVVPDRAEAIRRSLEEARPGDVVVIAGKGHETGQEARGVVTPFDDRLVAAAVLRELRPA